ncbi:MAG: hypothetical protein H0V43_00575 [Gemmatimonadales bacterium]|nr:hypothetical protein [Gemmatimonadales bacterium]MBA3553689.1 hypothetical protein [Gemmatimonadales bacterium]
MRIEIDFAAAGGVELGRLERSLELQGFRIAPGRYRITGGSQTHCGDHLWRERVCKHISPLCFERETSGCSQRSDRWFIVSGNCRGQPESQAAAKRQSTPPERFSGLLQVGTP